MRTVLFATIPQSSIVSSPVDLNQFDGRKAIAVPVITSGDLFVQGAFDTTSASFMRLMNPVQPGSGFLRWATLAGSMMLPLSQYAMPPYVRLETAVPQTNPATFTLLASRW